MTLPLYRKKTPKIRKIIGIAAGKGGVGKSFAALALARALVQKGFKTALLDADFYGPSLDKMIQIDKAPSMEEGILIPAEGEGIKFLSIAYFSETMAVRAPIASKWIKRFLKETAWGDLDYLIVDFPPGTGDIPLELSQEAFLEGVVLITTPQEIALKDVRQAHHMFFKTGVPTLGVLENMSYLEAADEKIYPFGAGGGKLLSDELGVPLLGEIPLEPALGRLSDLGMSFFKSEDPKLKAIQKTFLDLADRMESFKRPPMIKSLSPSGPHDFEIVWHDGVKQTFSLKKLEALCPCAGCNKGKKEIENLSAKGISLVGRYALKIDFLEGCNRGIFPFEYLKQIGIS